MFETLDLNGTRDDSLVVQGIQATSNFQIRRRARSSVLERRCYGMSASWLAKSPEGMRVGTIRSLKLRSLCPLNFFEQFFI